MVPPPAASRLGRAALRCRSWPGTRELLRAAVPACVAVLAISACSSPRAQTQTPSTATVASADTPVRASEAPGDPREWLAEAESALQREQPARAATLFARYLGRASADAQFGSEAAQAYRGLARAHEQLGDYDAAIRAYDGFLTRFPDDPDAARTLARRGACEAEIGQWERSAHSYAQVLELGGAALIPSQQVEAHARRGYALFQLGDHAAAERALAEADAIYQAATEAGEERFSDTYFVALARFYRAAILHLAFRAAPIRLPEAQMAKDFAHKLDLLEQAQAAYNQVVRAKHMYWVSAAGYQLGSLYEEFYDAVMHAPVPNWLDEAQRRVYYEALEEQLRPVIDKAAWVFEKNLETARMYGYDSEFIARSEAQLAQMQAILLGRSDPGSPVPRLAPIDARAGLAPDDEIVQDQLPAVDRKLFVPMPTTL
jgi:tetratricopeptide (TPR) repeat protein